jgi:hypothetical protein
MTFLIVALSTLLLASMINGLSWNTMSPETTQTNDFIWELVLVFICMLFVVGIPYSFEWVGIIK